MSKLSLKALRVNKNLTQDEASKLLGVSVNTLRNWESGKSFPDVTNVQKICDVYEAPFDMISFT